MKKDHTHITILLDRTGSMESIRDDTIGGFNAFLNGQKAEPGTATLTLVQFDTQDPYEVLYKFTPIGDVPELTRETFIPRAMTPLLDALGRGIIDLEKSISQLKEKDRPSKIVFVVVTDGQENSSREFRKDRIKKMIQEKTEKNDWQFVFLSADLSAIDDAQSVGFQANSVLYFHKSPEGVGRAFRSCSSRTSEYRSNVRRSVNFDFEDLQEPNDPPKDKE
jgi:hypothetical protein